MPTTPAAKKTTAPRARKATTAPEPVEETEIEETVEEQKLPVLKLPPVANALNLENRVNFFRYLGILLEQQEQEGQEDARDFGEFFAFNHVKDKKTYSFTFRSISGNETDVLLTHMGEAGSDIKVLYARGATALPLLLGPAQMAELRALDPTPAEYRRYYLKAFDHAYGELEETEIASEYKGKPVPAEVGE